MHGRRNGIATVCRLVPLGPSTLGGPFFSISVLYRRFRGPVTFIGVCARRYLYGNTTDLLLHTRWQHIVPELPVYYGRRADEK